MKVAKAYSHLDLRIEEMSCPEPSPGGMRVKMKACGLCTSDTLGWYVDKKAPMVLGHEPVGMVEKAGYDLPFQPGDRVFVHHHAPCGSCRYCYRGLYIQCPTWRKKGIHPGGLAEFFTVEPWVVKQDCLKLPVDIPDEDGTFIEPFACSLHALKKAGVRPDDRVLVISLGVMGFLNLYALKAYGVRARKAFDLTPERITLAHKLHLAEASTPTLAAQKDLKKSWDGGADLVLVGPGTLDALKLGFACLAPGGTLCLFTPLPEGTTYPLDGFHTYFKDHRFITSYSCDPEDTRLSYHLISQGFLPVSQLVTHRFPLEEAPEGLRMLARGGNVLKVIIYGH